MNRDLIQKGRISNKVLLVFILLLIAAIASLVVAGRANSPSNSGYSDLPDDSGHTNSTNNSGYVNLPNDLGEYFPLDTGREWTYKITIGKAQPMIYENVMALMGEGGVRIPFTGSFNVQADTTYYLKMVVKGPYQEEKRLMSVELDVLEDDMGLFRYTAKIFWGVDSFGSQAAMLLASEYSAEAIIPIYPQVAGAEIIQSTRIIFIWGGGKIVQEDKDSFAFIGTDNNVPGYQEIPCYHFIREVHPDESTRAKSFTEDYWYAPKKGLVRLEQKVEGITSMVWTLQ